MMTDALLEAPFVTLQVTVPSQWIDINGHMNATHYGLVIYDAHVKLTEILGLGEDYVNASHCSKAVLESHLIYEREVSEGDQLEVHSWLLAIDHKRLHFFHELFNLSKGFRAAASEQVDVHMDLKARRSSPIPDNLQQSLRKIVKAHLAQPRPEGVGSTIRPPKNTWLKP
ncbi:thioesterase family protein [Parahaliea sp. F7430]|uniref:Thioesterase family protein n=1 Tax=Sediminihaliea albiluteola TaxID=2758564 RepID=A0A7W2TVJ1_9GAMM|nr:thioesterase family protein [Sediminihaliea albiluteola]MBA6412649.1 thioesterase family protein [Sediminihaliea albiluteola]